MKRLGFRCAPIYICPTCGQDMREEPKPGRKRCRQCGQALTLQSQPKSRP